MTNNTDRLFRKELRSSDVVIKDYNNMPVAFKVVGGEVYVKANDMTNSNTIKHWKNSPKTDRYIKGLKSPYNLDKVLIFSDIGGSEKGTWIHEKLIDSLTQYINNRNVSIKQPSGLYIIKAGEYYKIGITSNITSRMKGIQTGNPHKLELIHYQQVEDALTVERELHDKYDEQRMMGEWFDIASEDVKSIIRGLNLQIKSK